MDNDLSFDSMAQHSAPENFSNSWNQMIGVEIPAFDENAFGLLLSGDVAEEDIQNALANSQEIVAVDPTSSQELINLIKDEIIRDADNSLVSVTSTYVSKPASLPASVSWEGMYGFKITFNEQEKKTKGVTWTYNTEKNKLYVGKEAPCPINFSTAIPMPEGVQIRAMALYSSPESASEVVERCVNHSLEDKAKDIFEAEHLVRCESPMAVYEVDVTTKRYSVVIPFENPPPGQSFSTYIYKFTCFGSCPGPNRRPLMLVFSLEKDNQVIGRCKVDVKICACPGRDSKTESKTEQEQSGLPKRRKKRSIEPEATQALVSSYTAPPAKKVKEIPDEDGHYKIMTKDRKCYEFLTQMKKYFHLEKTIKSLPPEVKRYLEQYQQRKGYRFPQDLNLGN